MNHSESIAMLAPAFVAAQAEIENAHKNAKNPHFKSTYADLAEIIDTIRPTLSKHGLSVIQIPGFRDGALTLDTMLLHTSGEWIGGESGSPISKQDPQAIGSAITYLRRYSLAAVCGIAQEDDDGNAASKPRKQEAPAPRAQEWAASVAMCARPEDFTLLISDAKNGDEKRQLISAARAAGYEYNATHGAFVAKA